jgi:translation initiation factor 1A
MPKNKGKVSCRYYSVSLPESTPLAKVFHCHFVVSACLAALRERGHHGIENDRKILDFDIATDFLIFSYWMLTFVLQGGKNRRRGKNENDNEKRELVFKEEGQEYAQVVKMLGNGRLEAMCFDGEKRLAHIRGKLRKKVWINQGDIILLSLRDYQDEKGDVIMKYTADEARSLKAYGELPEHAKINETDTYGHEGFEDNVEFDEDRESEDEKEIDVDEL